MTTATENNLPLPDQLSPASTLSSEPSDTGAAFSYRANKKEYLRRYRQRPEYCEQIRVYRERRKTKIENDPKLKKMLVDRMRLYGKNHYQANKPKILARCRARKQENEEHEKARARAYYLEHKDDYAVRARKYKERDNAINPPAPPMTAEESKRRKRERTRQWAIDNPEKRKALARSWASRNKDKIRSYSTHNAHNRRVGKHQSRKDNIAVYKWLRSWRSKRTVSCYWCQCRFRPSECHVDHITPISRGGKNTIENVCISCAPCNMKKKAKSISVWNQSITSPVLL